MPHIALLFVLVACARAAEDPALRFVNFGADGRLVYRPDSRGNRLPDFSHAGFGGGSVIPDVPVRVVIASAPGDSTHRIQAAIDFVAGLEPDASGLRGAVLLLEGRHEIAGQVRITAGGIVMRGRGNKTVLVASGTGRRALVRVCGRNDRWTEERARTVTDEFVPAGVDRLHVSSADGLAVGDAVSVEHPGTRRWVATLGMDHFPSRDRGSYLDWRPGTMNVRWERTVTRVKGTEITLDAPIPYALDAAQGVSTVRKFRWPGRARNVGIESLRLESAFDATNPNDEAHAWTGISIENAEDIWVRQVAFAHFAGSAVAVWETGRRITVEDCAATDPVSEVGGYRRQSFFTAGQQTLFLRCSASQGRHDFAVGHLAAGPNAFVRCQATNASQFSGPIGSWATGVLYDNVKIDGAGLALTNRETFDQGVGWAAANSVLWQCTAPVVTCRMPPSAQNWAIGVWGQFVGDGHWRQLNEFAKPSSLFEAQLADRLGDKAALILKSRVIPADTSGGKRIDEVVFKQAKVPPQQSQPLKLAEGRLTIAGKPVVGSRMSTAWWRGSTLPSRATEVGVGVTRFVPGREGPGFTDDLSQLTDDMKAKGVAVLEHHWGLWYDRRRDDHQMLRRADADVWAPFYEQPWARSGRGRAWDGLSKYDLTRFNPWYFARLKEFADLAGRKGLILVQQMYFQHNVLEAGAHWADFPWRPANCQQATGFPEPPDYAGDKRVFMASAFYDTSHPIRRDLHRRYIRQCLDTLAGCSNVIFQIGEEFTGPQHFVEFWLDTIAEWKAEKGLNVLVGLSCTKDVQDAILADSRRAGLVSVIDLKYWWYTTGGGVYDPKGGENQAPRQQLRAWKGNKSRSDAEVVRAVREYRTRFPDKAVTVSLEGANGWAVLAAGGSIPRLASGADPSLCKALARMRPWEGKGLPSGAIAIADPGRDYLVWAPAGGPISIELHDPPKRVQAHWVNPKSGKLAAATVSVAERRTIELSPPGAGQAVLWLSATN